MKSSSYGFVNDSLRDSKHVSNAIISPDDAFMQQLVNRSAQELKLLDCHTDLPVYSCASIPEGLITNGDQLQGDVLNKNNQVIDFDVPARNLLRYIVRGTEINGSKHKEGLAFVQHALEEKKHPGLLKALRKELKNILEQIAKRVVKKDDFSEYVSPDQQTHYEILVSNLLAAYPFIDPEDNEFITIPQKMKNGEWKRIEYKLNEIDISPQTGLLSYLIKPEDKIYAYGMVPKEDKKAESLLSLMGTTYTTGQGENLSVLRNFNPNHSVGEAHDMTKLGEWIKKQTKVKVTGHSQGGTLAMIVAAKYPAQVSRADCLNPTALTHATLKRLNPEWNKLSKENKPHIYVYAQQGDPVYPLENGFLSGTRLLRVIPGSEKCSELKPFIPRFIQRASEAHLHHFVGRETSIILEMDAKTENFTGWREFRAAIKSALNWCLFPFMYTKLVGHLITRNMKEWCQANFHKYVNWAGAFFGFIPYYAIKFAIVKIITPAIKLPVLISGILLTALASAIVIGATKLKNWISSPIVKKPVVSVIVPPPVIRLAAVPANEPQQSVIYGPLFAMQRDNQMKADRSVTPTSNFRLSSPTA